MPLPRALSDDPERVCSATSTASTIHTIPESDWAPISSLGLHWSPTRNTALYTADSLAAKSEHASMVQLSAVAQGAVGRLRAYLQRH